jgi:hypothetical protein
MKRIVVSLLGLMVFFGQIVSAADIPPDPRMEKLLKKARLEYQYDAKAGFKLVNRFSTERLQAVFIESVTHDVGNMEVRKLWSIAFMDDAIEPAMLRRLMVDNQNLKVGRWSIAQINDREAVIFSATMDADARLGELLSKLSIVTGSADELEKSLVTEDSY